MNNLPSPTLFWSSPTGKLAYDDTGVGPLVVCVPSMGDLRQEYRFLAPRLVAAGFRVVTVDVRGHGESTIEGTDFSVAGVGADLAGLISHLNAGPAHVIGDSMAAGAAVWLAAEYPRLVAKLILVGAFVRSKPNLLMNLLFTVLASGPWGAVAWAAFYTSLYPTKKPEDFAKYLVELKRNLSAPARRRALLAMIRASKDASEERLPRVKAPVLVVMGSKDPDFPSPEAEARWIAEALHAPYRMVEGAGHYPHAEMPDTVTPMVLEFLKS